MLDVFAPSRSDADNRRHDPFFDKHLMTGKTYTTANGKVVPNELQYYDGEMAHLYGECSNVAPVRAALKGSGYRPITLKYSDGRHVAVAQLWANKFTDTSIGPYAAMFIVVAAVADDASETQACIRADSNGASSVLVMLDGSVDSAAKVYENKARLFMFRLLDTTEVAIDVGRERMGTDKRPGTVDMQREGRRLRISIDDRHERGVVRADLALPSDPASYSSAVAQAAATAGITSQALPPGSEYVYPSVARIGQGPIVCWQWRSDVTPWLQPVTPGSVIFDPSSEEGYILDAWGFAPKVLGYFPKVRGVITGLAEPTPRRAGENWVESASVPGGGLVAIPSIGPDVGARQFSSIHTTPLQAAFAQIDTVPLLRAPLPGEPSGLAGVLPVLRLVGQELWSRSGSSIRPPAHEDHQGTQAADAMRSQPYGGADTHSRWAWDARFLGSFTAFLRKETIGATPDGWRINWHVTRGTFVGPGFDAVVLPGAVDWMCIRRDGTGIVNVSACLETRDHVRVYVSYGGIVDLGPDGYARATRDEYDRLPPVVVTPTYATTEPALEWLNRAQCIGVGRVDLTEFRVEFDVYVIRVGERADQASSIVRQPASASDTLYKRIGGYDVIAAVSDDFLAWGYADKQLSRFFVGHAEATFKILREHVLAFLCQLTGGPCVYLGRDMKTAHKGLRITASDWKIADDLFVQALNKHKVGTREQSEFMQIIRNMKDVIVEIP